ncbi:nitrogen regulation protein NR(II) [Thalassotalea profundi]|uniref:nitrogen regulation protein NR(II) n=1 Tax=Thalassotalea profundi TaxID=2036687 RepID=UPI004032FFE3
MVRRGFMLSTKTNVKKIKLDYQQKIPNQLVTAIIVLDKNLTIQYANPATEALLVKSFNKLYGKPLKNLFLNEPIKQERLTQLLISGQEFSDSDVTLELYINHLITVELMASSVEFDAMPHILLELKQIDQQKNISAEAFQHQQWESARELIRGLAHEIKNPLGGLRGAAQLLSKELSQEQQEYTMMIIEQADRLTNLVDRLLGPNQLPKMTKLNIHSVLEKIYQVVRFGNEKNINFIRDYDPSIPDVVFDDDKLQQALLNIVNNAIQVIETGGQITLKTRAATNQTINGKRIKLCAKICIIDNGPGIPENLKDTLFYPMVSGRANGTGLGLSISQTLIHQHNGKLSCSSEPGHTEFEILLPIIDKATK